MDIIQELTIDTVWLQSLYICEPILQWFIDEDIAERRGNRYFGKKWNKSQHAYVSTNWYNVTTYKTYKHGKNIERYEERDDELYGGMKVVNEVTYITDFEMYHVVQYEGLSLMFDEHWNLTSVTINGPFIYKSMTVNAMEITDVVSFVSMEQYFDMDGVKYAMPDESCSCEGRIYWIYRKAKDNIVIDAGQFLEYSQVWHENYINKKNIKQYVEKPVPGSIKLYNPLDTRLFVEVMNLLPPIDIETALYNPGAYISLLESINVLVKPHIQRIKWFN